MADTVDYVRVHFSCGVHVLGSTRLQRIDAKPGVRLYRDLARPDTLVVLSAHKAEEHVPWALVAGAKVMKPATVAALVPQDASSEAGQGQGQGKPQQGGQQAHSQQGGRR